MSLSGIVLDVGRSRTNVGGQVATVTEFVEATWGLHMPLFPVQRVIIKAHYGLELDDTDTFQVSDWRREKFRTFTEASYLAYLHDEGRSNIREVIPGHERREMVLSIGRRSGKTLLASTIAAYETYKLIQKGDPQGYYGLPSSNNIQIIAVATDKDQAGLLYQEASGHFRECGFFSPYTANNTQTYARFQTPKDIDRYGQYSDDPTAKATLKVTFRSCVAKGLRGAGNIVVILDEVAHFTEDGQTSAEAVYNAVTPSTSAFSPKDAADRRIPTGPVEGRIISISSPLGRQGQFYKLFQLAMRGGSVSSNMIAIQAPTWEVNPTIPASEFEKHYLKDPVVFFTEYGGEFTDRTRGWIEREEDLVACIDPKARPLMAAPPKRPHFVGIDIALVNDGSACAIGHLDDSYRIVVDLVDGIKAGEGRFAHVDRLEFDDVADWIYQLSRKFYMAEGIFDQWAGIPFEQALAKKGLRQLKSEHMTKNLNSDIYRNFKDMMWDKRLVLYDWPIPASANHCDYIAEMLELQADSHTKYLVDVHAPKIDGKHDDRSDALVRMVWVASQHLGKPKFIGGAGTGGAGNRGGMMGHESAYRHAMMKAKQMGSSPDRQASRFNRFRIRGR